MNPYSYKRNDEVVVTEDVYYNRAFTRGTILTIHSFDNEGVYISKPVTGYIMFKYIVPLALYNTKLYQALLDTIE